MRLVTICGASYLYLVDHTGRGALHFVKQTGKFFSIPGYPDHSLRICRYTDREPSKLGPGNRFAPPTEQEYLNHDFDTDA